jgi:hypothetical protein
MENLECPVCLEICRDAVECCQCAQIFCDLCTCKLNKCPMCRKESSFRPSAFARRLINNLPIKCPSCNIQFSKNELERHISVCPNRKIVCTLCKMNFNSQNLLSHGITEHIDNLLLSFSDPYENSNEYKIEVLWGNKTKILSHTFNGLLTRTAEQPFENISIGLKLRSTNSSYIVVGFSSKKICIPKGYLGGDLGTGNWGIAGNGNIGEEGSWKAGTKYTNNDIIRISFNEGLITYSVNNKPNNYSYFLKTPTAYLACTLFTQGDELEIMD